MMSEGACASPDAPRRGLDIGNPRNFKHDFEPAPMLLGFVLGPLMEENLRRAMLIARGDPSTFITRPISGVLIALAVLPMIRSKRDEVFVE
jgi:putative tricarboxylic transport membrane protein